MLLDFTKLRKELKFVLQKWREKNENTISTSGNIKHFYNYVNKKLFIKKGSVRSTDNQDNFISDTDAAEMLNDYF